MCEREGTACPQITGIGGVEAGACELLDSALEARDSVQRQPVMGRVDCPDSPRILVAPLLCDFGVTRPGVTVSAQATIEIANIGNSILAITAVTVLPVGERHFRMVSPLGSRSIAPSARQSLRIECAPTTQGSLHGAVRIESNAVNVDAPVTVPLRVIAGYPAIAVEPSSHDFGEVLAGRQSAHRTFVITNPGVGNLTLNGATFSAAGFSLVAGDIEGIVAPLDADSTARVAFTVAGQPATAGAVEIVLAIGSDARVPQAGSIRLTMKGVRPEIAVASSECRFGEILVGGAGVTRSIVVTNPGSAPLHIARVELGDASHFTLGAQAGQPPTLAPDAAWTFEVVGLPAACGDCATQLLIHSDAQNETQPLTIALDARGVAPDIEVSMRLCDFATVLLGKSTHKVITITNTGTAPLHLSDIALGDTSHFAASGLPTLNEPIGVGESRDMRVVAQPGLAGLLAADLAILSDARGGPVTVPLTVIGQQPTVTIAPSPGAVLFDASAPKNAQLTATGTPDGGSFAWRIEKPATANFVGADDPGDTPQVSIEGLAAGTTNVTVTYTVDTAPPATATVEFHVVQVTIAQGASLLVVHPYGQPAANVVLTAVGTPVDGASVFQPLVHDGGLAALAYSHGTTVTSLNATLVTQRRGRSTATVAYTKNDVIATATIDVNVTTLACSKVRWAPAGVANVVPLPIAPCPHEAAREQPTTAVATVAPSHPHHHGGKCAHCALSGRDVHHYIESGTDSAAVKAVKELRDEIHRLRVLLGATYIPGNAMNPAAARYVANRPWLADVPVWMFDPAGWEPVCSKCNGAGRLRPDCRSCEGTGRHGRNQCAHCRGTGKGSSRDCHPCGGTGRRAREGFGKMIGVLIARDAQGRTWRLRGVSGTFAGIAADTPPYGAANAYWARRLPDRSIIPSASRGQRDYADQAPTFGICAATHMLAQALDQQLELLSMAEIWIGATNDEGREDGQLQASCPHCRRYFQHMLCEGGGQARERPYAGGGTVRNRGLRVAIQEGPQLYLAPQDEIVLHGSYDVLTHSTVKWAVRHDAIATITGADNQASATVRALQGGSTQVALRYTGDGLTTSEFVFVHVLAFSQQGPLTLSLAGGAGKAVGVLPLENAGTLQWGVANAGVARVAGAGVPGNIDTVILEPVSAGSTQLTVALVNSGGVSVATATITVNVI